MTRRMQLAAVAIRPDADVDRCVRHSRRRHRSTTSSSTSSTAPSARRDVSACRTGSWRVLPIVFADKLPNRPGNGWETDRVPLRNAPIAITRSARRTRTAVRRRSRRPELRHVPRRHVPRSARSAPRQVVLGMPAHQMDLQGYGRFLSACAQDPRFNAGHADRRHQQDRSRLRLPRRASSIDSWSCARTRDGILERAQENSWFDARPPQGPGPRRHVQSLQGDVRRST